MFFWVNYENLSALRVEVGVMPLASGGRQRGELGIEKLHCATRSQHSTMRLGWCYAQAQKVHQVPRRPPIPPGAMLRQPVSKLLQAKYKVGKTLFPPPKHYLPKIKEVIDSKNLTKP